MNLLNRAKQYFQGERILSGWVGSGAEVVEQEHAQKRADVCTGRISGKPCSLNQPGFIPIESIALNIKRLIEFKKNLKLRVKGEKTLFTCTACQCPMKTKIWIPMEKILPEPSEYGKFDERCWLLTENKP